MTVATLRGLLRPARARSRATAGSCSRSSPRSRRRERRAEADSLRRARLRCARARRRPADRCRARRTRSIRRAPARRSDRGFRACAGTDRRRWTARRPARARCRRARSPPFADGGAWLSTDVTVASPADSCRAATPRASNARPKAAQSPRRNASRIARVERAPMVAPQVAGRHGNARSDAARAARRHDRPGRVAGEQRDSIERRNALRPPPIRRLNERDAGANRHRAHAAGRERPVARGAARAVDRTKPIEHRAPPRARRRPADTTTTGRADAAGADQQSAQPVGVVDQRERDRGRLAAGQHDRERVVTDERVSAPSSVGTWRGGSLSRRADRTGRTQSPARRGRRSAARAARAVPAAARSTSPKIEGSRCTHVDGDRIERRVGNDADSPVDAWTIATAACRR